MELQDKIGRDDIINKITTLVDNLRANEHFCLALDGEWGSGKSFVLDMLCQQFEPIDNYLVVRYDAWECSFYDEPLVAILSNVMDSTVNISGYKKALKTKAKALGKSILKNLSSMPGEVGAVATVIQTGAEVISSFKQDATLDTKDGKVAEFKSYQTFLKDIKENLNKFTEGSNNSGKQNKLIILVDEVDRCLPDMQLKILERLHHLFDVKNCVVICAVNANSVAQNVKTTYGVDGFDYLRKFFDYTYKIHKSTSEYIATLLGDLASLTNKMNEYAKNANEPTTLAHMCLAYGTSHVLNNIDNREATRFYNAIVQICNDFGWEKLSPQFLFFIIIGLFIRRYLYNNFLSEKDILTRNKDIKQRMSGTMQEMPYFDYIKHYIGVERNYLPDQMNTIVGEKYPTYTWEFNEMVYRSIGGTGAGNVDKEKCTRLRELILIYAGESNIKETK